MGRRKIRATVVTPLLLHFLEVWLLPALTENCIDCINKESANDENNTDETIQMSFT